MKLTPIQIGVLIISGLIAFSMAQSYPPEFFDNFGVIVFAFLGGLGIYMLNTKKEVSDNVAFILLWIAEMGLIVDFSIVLN